MSYSSVNHPSKPIKRSDLRLRILKETKKIGWPSKKT